MGAGEKPGRGRDTNRRWLDEVGGVFSPPTLSINISYRSPWVRGRGRSGGEMRGWTNRGVWEVLTALSVTPFPLGPTCRGRSAFSGTLTG